ANNAATPVIRNVVVFSTSDAPPFLWAKKGAGSGEFGSGLAPTTDSGAFVTGGFFETSRIGGTLLNSAGKSDMFMARYDETGGPSWVMGKGGTGRDYVYSAAADASDNLIVAGFFQEQMDFGGTTMSSLGGYDGSVAKFDDKGSLLWVKSVGGAGDDFAKFAVVRSVDSLWLSGEFSGTSQIGNDSLSSTAGSQDVFLSYLSSTGTFQWSISFGGSGDESVTGCAAASDGGVFVSGEFRDSLTIQGTTLVSQGFDDAFLAKFNSTGQLQWAKSIGGSSSDSSRGLASDSSGNVFWSGSFLGAVTFEGTTLSNSGNADAFVVKCDSNGNLKWVKNFGGSLFDYAAALALDDRGQLYLAGSFQGTAAFGSIALSSAGDLDVFLAKIYPDSGNVLWAKKAGGIGVDQPRGLVINADGAALLTGYFEDSASFDDFSLTTTGSRGLFVAKIGAPQGNPSFATTPLLAAIEGVAFQYTASVDSWSGDPLLFTSRNLPDWLTLQADEGTGVATLSGTPMPGDVGLHSVEIRVTDGVGGASSQSFTITVGNSNGEPFFTSYPSATAYYGQPYTYSISAYDSNGDALRFQLGSGAPDWLTLTDNLDGSATLSGASTDATMSSTSVTIRLIEGATMVDQTFVLTTSGGWWQGAKFIDEKWISLDWMGLVNLASPEWIYHEQLGWLFVNGASPSSIWLWLPGVGWLWTSDSTYPYLFDHTLGDWSYFYQDPASAKRYFYRYSSGSWSEL
ncbi:MAG: putative Ig domain-containing protein, partial [Opitutales bacterium]